MIRQQPANHVTDTATQMLDKRRHRCARMCTQCLDRRHRLATQHLAGQLLDRARRRNQRPLQWIPARRMTWQQPADHMADTAAQMLDKRGHRCACMCTQCLDCRHRLATQHLAGQLLDRARRRNQRPVQRVSAFLLARQQYRCDAPQARAGSSQWPDRRRDRGVGRCRQRLHRKGGVADHGQRRCRITCCPMCMCARQRGAHAKPGAYRCGRGRGLRFDRDRSRCIHPQYRRQRDRGAKRSVRAGRWQGGGHNLLGIGSAVLGDQVLQVGQLGVGCRSGARHRQRNGTAQTGQAPGY